MSLPPGSLVGVYEVTALLGEGGMGQVYRARDTKLNRDVALKVLPDSFASDPDRLVRFTREAQTLAALNHPNIAHIHGLEESGRIRALVMELVEGEDLSQRIARGAIPIDEALPIGRQVAEALEAAHEQGIIHRDLKPANIKVRADGTVKVLDFGLAKAMDSGPGAGDPRLGHASQAPTITTPAMTQAGMILGTAAYMAPEQARGKAVDKRADIWAFGCVLFEMLTGQRAFNGEDVSDTLAAVLRAEPPWARLPPSVAPAIRSLLRRCLERDVRRRVGDLSTARFVIEEAAGLAPSGAGAPEVAEDQAADGPAARRHERLAWAVATGLLLSTVTLGVGWSRSGSSSASPPAPEMRVELNTAQRVAEAATFALSPDGTNLAFVSEGQVWVRSLQSEDAEPLVRIDGAIASNTGNLFWAPDGKSVGLLTQGQLRRIELATGFARSLAAAPTPLGGTWASDDTILFVPSPASPVVSVSASGGETAVVTTVAAGQVGHRFPQFLPDGRHFLFLVVGTKETRGIYVGSLDSRDTSRILESDSRAVFSPPDVLMYMRDGALEARRLNLGTLALEGEPVTIAPRVLLASNSYNNVAASGSTGRVVYRAHGGVRRWVWVDREGGRLAEIGDPDAASPNELTGSLSGDLVGMQRTVNGNADVWVLDTERGIQRRLSFGAERDSFPTFSPDGSRVAFSSERTGVYDLFERPADGSGQEALVLSSPEPKLAEDWSPDGRTLLFTVQNRDAMDLWALPLDGNGQAVPLTRTPFTEREGRFSPDGRWIAYQSNETGRNEIFIQSFPDPGVRVQVSARGGQRPTWRRDGRELFYEEPGDRVMAVSLDLSASAVKTGPPVFLFQGNDNWRPSPDGQRFLVAEEAEPPAPITLILNWAGVPR